MSALEYFIDAINATGGVSKGTGGFWAPVGDPDWTDLGDAYMQACEELGVAPVISTADEEEET